VNRRQLLQASRGALFAPLAASAADAPGAAGLRVFDPRSFGAKGDGKTLDTAAINRAIDACHAAGGGIVYLSPGAYLSGTVVLKSNVTLYLEAQATLLGSKDLADYAHMPGPSELGDANQKHLVFARGAENVGIAGPGRIDGQGAAFWVPSGRVVPPPEDSWRDVATYDWKPLDRPSPLVEIVECRNVRIEDVRIENASGWTLRPINCDDVWIRGITIKNPIIGPNTDGIDPTGCQNLFISDCRIETGDDCICLKSENPYGSAVRVTKNVVITNCVLTCCCNGLKFGTATKGGFENVTFTNSVIFNERVDPKARVISGIAIEMVDGGWVEGVAISNIRMQNVRTPIFIRLGARRARPDGTPGTLRGVTIDNVHATGAILTNSITGLPGYEVEDVTLSNIRVDSEENGKAAWAARAIPEQAQSYPEARMFGRLPAHGLYCRHVKGLRLRGVELRGGAAEERPTLVCDDVRDLEVSSFRGTMRLIQTRAALLSGCVPPDGAKPFLQVEGGQSARIAVVASDLSGAAQAVAVANGAKSDAVSVKS
jgi:polygalacturonase